jgi:hypothetical protein
MGVQFLCCKMFKIFCQNHFEKMEEVLLKSKGLTKNLQEMELFIIVN